MEYNFNYKLKFQVPQPSAAPLKSGARAMPIWCVRGACLARPRCPSGSPAVPVWLTCGARTVHVWLARGACLARSQCASGSFVVRV